MSQLEEQLHSQNDITNRLKLQNDLLVRNLQAVRENHVALKEAYDALLADFAKSGTKEYVLFERIPDVAILTAIIKYVSICERTKQPIDPVKLYELIVETKE